MSTLVVFLFKFFGGLVLVCLLCLLFWLVGERRGLLFLCLFGGFFGRGCCYFKYTHRNI